MNNTQVLESLESRTMMSATPVLYSAAVRADRTEIHVDLIKLKSTLFADARSLAVDNRALHADHLRDNTVLKPLVEKLRSDVRSFGLTLKGDRLNDTTDVLADKKAIAAEIKKFIADRKNPTARATDVVQLIADRTTFENDIVAGLTQRLTERQVETTAIQADAQAILTALPTSGANAKLTADATLWLSNKNGSLANVTADLQKLSADRTQLITDLNAG